MSHPAEGTLRRLIDDPAGVADTERAHLAACRHCLEELAAVVALALSKLTRDSGQRVLVQIGNSGISKANGMRRWEK